MAISSESSHGAAARWLAAVVLALATVLAFGVATAHGNTMNGHVTVLAATD